MKRFLIALMLLASLSLCPVYGQQAKQPPRFDPLAITNRARMIMQQQRDEYLNKYVDAETLAGLLLEESNVLRKRIGELEAKIKELEAKLKELMPPADNPGDKP